MGGEVGTASENSNSLALGEIDLWFADYDEINDERLHTSYRALLSDDEKRQEPRFYFARDRRRYLVTRALVRTVLSRYVQVRPQDWKFSINAYGRPEIANSDEQALELTFSISHTHSLIVLGVTRGRKLGVDVENISIRDVSIEVATRFFSPAEVSELATVPQSQQRYRFFEYWTFIESYIKARGMGLSLPVDKFSFHYPDSRTVEIVIHPELSDEPGQWQFWSFMPTQDYLVAVCAGRINDARSEIVARQIVPMVSEEAIASNYVRTSRSISTIR